MADKKIRDTNIRVDPAFKKEITDIIEARRKLGLDKRDKTSRRITRAMLRWELFPDMKKALETRRMDDE